MVRFIRNLFARESAPARRPAKTVLGVQTLESREAPAGIGHAISQIASAIAHQVGNNNHPNIHGPSTVYPAQGHNVVHVSPAVLANFLNTLNANRR